MRGIKIFYCRNVGNTIPANEASWKSWVFTVSHVSGNHLLWITFISQCLLFSICSCKQSVKPITEKRIIYQYEDLSIRKIDPGSVKAPEIKAFDESKIKIVSSAVYSSTTIAPLNKVAGEPLQVDINIETAEDILAPAPIAPKVVPAKGKVHHGFFPEIVPAKDMAQEVQNMLGISYYGKLQGLKHDYICKMIQDRRGNIWLATRGGGVCRYDGQNFAHFTEKEGLVSNDIWDIMEDRQGNIWMASNGNGISRYQGNIGNVTCTQNKCEHDLKSKSGRIAHQSKLRGTFTNFRMEDGLPNHYTKALFEDDHGRIWFSVRGGVCIYDGKNFTYLGKEQGLPEKDVQYIASDREGNIWMSTLGGGLLRINYERMQHPCWLRTCGHRQEEVAERIKHQREVYKSFVMIKSTNRPELNDIYTLLFDSRNQLWVGTARGMIQIQASALKSECFKGTCSQAFSNEWPGEHAAKSFAGKVFAYNNSNGLSGSMVLGLQEDHRHHIWIACYDGGINRFDGKTFKYIGEKQGLPKNQTFCTLEDRYGNIWIGGRNSGISRYSGEAFTHLSELEGLSDRNVYGITGDSSGTIWMACENGNFTSLKGGEIRTRSWPKDEENAPAYCISRDSKGAIWQGHWGGGVVCLNDEKLKFFKGFGQSNGLLINFVVADQHDNIWVGAWDNGIWRYDGKTVIHYSAEQGLTSDKVLSGAVDKEGNLWVGMFDGSINILKPKNPESPCNKKSCSHRSANPADLNQHLEAAHYELSIIENNEENIHQINSILCDKNGDIWIGELGNGIRHIKTKRALRFNSRNGLNNDLINALSEDSSGNIWIGSGNGIIRLNRKEFNKIVSDIESDRPGNPNQLFDYFTYADGFLGVGTNRNAMWMGPEMELWMGTKNRVTIMKQDEIKKDTIIPEIQLMGVDLFNEKTDWTSAAMVPDTSFRLNNGIEISDFRFDSLMRWSEVPIQLSLAHHTNFLTFRYMAPCSFKAHKMRYCYMLDGLEKNWNSPTEKTEANYGNLSPGKYLFKVYAINSEGLKGEEFHYGFTIRPPWWKTWWAYASYVILTLLSLVLFIRRRERNLKQRQRELEVKVDEATSEIRHQKEEIEKEKNRSDELLLNILPEDVAEELKNKGEAEAKQIDEVTVLFTDFKGFTSLSEKLSPKELVDEIHTCFSAFDKIMLRHGVEKIKTIGDAYMAAGGLPVPNKTHAQNVVNAALDIQAFMEIHKKERQALGALFFEIRIGVHTGPVVAGIVGVKKFAYDIWGDTVNTASRMESSGEVGKVNISDSTYARVKDDFTCTYRGKIQAKGKGEINMYFVEGKIIR